MLLFNKTICCSDFNGKKRQRRLCQCLGSVCWLSMMSLCMGAGLKGCMLQERNVPSIVWWCLLFQTKHFKIWFLPERPDSKKRRILCLLNPHCSQMHVSLPDWYYFWASQISRDIPRRLISHAIGREDLVTYSGIGYRLVISKKLSPNSCLLQRSRLCSISFLAKLFRTIPNKEGAKFENKRSRWRNCWCIRHWPMTSGFGKRRYGYQRGVQLNRRALWYPK